jgi:hypothetical protein
VGRINNYNEQDYLFGTENTNSPTQGTFEDIVSSVRGPLQSKIIDKNFLIPLLMGVGKATVNPLMDDSTSKLKRNALEGLGTTGAISGYFNFGGADLTQGNVDKAQEKWEDADAIKKNIDSAAGFTGASYLLGQVMNAAKEKPSFATFPKYGPVADAYRVNAAVDNFKNTDSGMEARRFYRQMMSAGTAEASPLVGGY